MGGLMKIFQENITESQTTSSKDEEYPRFDYKEPPYENESWYNFLVRHERNLRNYYAKSDY
jgi:hypothetical protein